MTFKSVISLSIPTLLRRILPLSITVVDDTAEEKARTAKPSATICKALQELKDSDSNRPSVYLDGPLQMCTAEPWLDKAIAHLRGLPVTIFDPRRDDLEAFWQDTRDTSTSPEEVQAAWELKHQKAADIVVIYVAPGLQTPKRLRTLAACASSGKLMICCPDGSPDKRAVIHACWKYNVRLFASFEALLEALVEELRKQVPQEATLPG